jgi:hypothetical protein
MDELKSAVECALDPNAPRNVKQEAILYCENLRTRNDGWRMCMHALMEENR